MRRRAAKYLSRRTSFQTIPTLTSDRSSVVASKRFVSEGRMQCSREIPGFREVKLYVHSCTYLRPGHCLQAERSVLTILRKSGEGTVCGAWEGVPHPAVAVPSRSLCTCFSYVRAPFSFNRSLLIVVRSYPLRQSWTVIDLQCGRQQTPVPVAHISQHGLLLPLP